MHNYHKAGQLEDCLNEGQGTELFIVEGESAAKALCRVRSPRWQAILPMQGKPMNATKASEHELRNNAQFAALLQTLGTDLGQSFDASKCRYERIILLFDPDADGIHARTLMLLFFHEWMKPLLDAGRIYDARAPRWRIESPDFERPKFLSTDEQFQQIKKQLDEAGTPFQQKRYRGLGSIEADTLATFCTDKQTRHLTQLKSQDAQSAIAFFENLRRIMNPE